MQDTDSAPLLDVISRAETLDQTVAAIPMAVVVFDLEGRIVLWGGLAESVYGWKASEVIGRPARELLVAPESGAFADEIRVRLNRGEQWTGTFPVVRKGGSTFDAFVIGAPVRSADGNLVGVVGLSLDTVDSQLAEAELAIHEARFRGIVDAAHDGIWMIDVVGRTTFANQHLADLLGCDLGVLETSAIYDFMADADVAEAMAIIDHLRSGVPQHFVVRMVRTDGRPVHVDIATTPMFGSDGEVVGALGTVTDVTQEREAERTIAEQRERLDLALQAGDLAVWELDLASGVFTMWDDAAVVYGIHSVREAPTLTDFLDLVVEEDQHLFRTPPPPVGAAFTYEYRIRHHDGVAWLRSHGRVIGDEFGAAVTLRGTSVDITESVLAVAQQAEVATVHRETLQAVPDAFVGTDGDGRVTDWNPAAEAMFGWSAADIVGERLTDCIFLREDRALYQQRIEALSTIGNRDVPPGRIELVVQHRDGRAFPVEFSIVMVVVDGGPRLRAFIRDITDQRAYEQELTDRVLVDQLTGLPNRTLLVDRLGRAIARVGARNVHAAVLFIDVDRLMAINESLGHSAGDAVLVAVAGRLRDVVGELYTIARHGGDEFIVLCEDLAGPEDAERLADQIQRAFALPLAVTGRRLTVGLSIGLAAVTSADDQPDELIRDADIAMHQAKALGGGRVEVLAPATGDRMSDRLDLEQALRQALIMGEITVAYQPVVHFDGRLVSMEALARWEHPERGTITPAEFIPVAEDTGLIVELGAQLLDTACAQLAEWRRKPGWERLTLAANLSGRQLVEPDLVETVGRILAAHDLPVDALCLEITESMLMDESSQAADTVDALAALGIVLSVDDFGTGYSSLLYLRRFPVHALKLDRSFVAGMGTNDVDTAIVGSMIDLARSLKLASVAEGVETVEQAQALKDRGCDLAQGYLFSRPVPAAEFTKLLDDPRFA